MVSNGPATVTKAETLTCAHCTAKRSIPSGTVLYGGRFDPVEEWALLHGANCPHKPGPTAAPRRARWKVTLEVRP